MLTTRSQGILDFASASITRAIEARSAERFAKAASKVLILVDQEIAKQTGDRTGPPTACARGCSSCCHGQICVSLPELLMIYSHVQNWETERRDSLGNRLDRSPLPIQRGAENLVRRPCLFLQKGECEIYDHRPAPCRSRHQTDRQRCDDALAQGRLQPEDDYEDQAVLNNAFSLSNRAQQSAQIQAGAFELGPTVVAMIENPSMLEDFSAHSPLWEKWKLNSEWNRETISYHPVMGALKDDAAKRGIVEKLLTSEFDDAQRDLRAYRGSAFAVVYGLSYRKEFRSEEEIESSWIEYEQALEAFENSKFNAREVFELYQTQSPFALPYAGRDVKQFLARQMGRLHRYAQAALPGLTAPMPAKRKPGPLRVGLISYRVKDFNGSKWALGWVRGMRGHVETSVFNLTESEDWASIAFRQAADAYYHLPFPVSDVAPFIRDQDLDALIFTDIGMDGFTTQLSVLRLARVQYNCWGHPVTSGSPTMDFYLSSDLMEPECGDEHYTETLVRLPGSGLCHVPTDFLPSHKSAADLGLPGDGFYICCQNPSKITPRHDRVFHEITEGSGKPIVFTSGTSAVSEILTERMRLAGVNALYRTNLLNADFLRALQLATASLDPFDWHGGNTTIDSLCVGTPVISNVGEYMRGRHGLAFLPIAGVGDLVASSEDGYIELALDTERQEDIMSKVHPEFLFEDNRPVDSLLHHLHENCRT